MRIPENLVAIIVLEYHYVRERNVTRSLYFSDFCHFSVVASWKNIARPDGIRGEDICDFGFSDAAPKDSVLVRQSQLGGLHTHFLYSSVELFAVGN